MIVFISLYSVLSLGVFSSCSSTPNYEKDHQDFMSLANRARSEMDKSAYKKWLNQKLQEKQSHLQAVSGWQEREEKIHGQYEMMDSSTASTVGGPDLHEFKARNSAQTMQRNDEQMKLLQREIFYLKSQLSALESNP